MVLVLAVRSIRSSIFSISMVKTLLNPTLLVPATLSLGWNAAVVYELYRVDLWSQALWWDTLVFAFVGTTALVWRVRESRDYSRWFYARIGLQTLGLSLLLGTMVSTYTFSLPVELVLVLWLALLGATRAVASSSEQYAAAAKATAFLITLSGIAMLSRAVGGAIADYEGFVSIQTVQSLLLLFFLTVAYLPYLFSLRVWMTYKEAFTPLRRAGGDRPLSVDLYARARILARHRFDLSRLEQFRTGPANDLRGTTTKSEVDEVFEQAKRHG